MSCKVQFCNYPYSHTTIGHKCGTCGKYGHGQMECNDIEAISNLEKYYSEQLPKEKHCNIESCKYKWSHCNLAHHCHKCNMSHGSKQCKIKTEEDFLRDKRDLYNLLDTNKLNFIKENINNNKYLEIYLGMGSNIYVRNKNNKIEFLYMHSDYWGQYGPTIDHSKYYEAFIKHINIVEYEPTYYHCDKIIKCPICRTKNKTSEILEVKGSSEKCSVCLENNIELYLSKCYHSCLCKTCFKQL